MPSHLSVNAIDASTYIVTASFTDENDDPVEPNELYWSLQDKDDTVINDREEESISPATSITVVLQGDDLAISGNREVRYFKIWGTYDSDLGSDLPIADKASFDIIKGS